MPVPPAVEDVARDDDEDAPAAHVRHREPRERQDDQEEDREGGGREDQARRFWRRWAESGAPISVEIGYTLRARRIGRSLPWSRVGRRPTPPCRSHSRRSSWSPPPCSRSLPCPRPPDRMRRFPGVPSIYVTYSPNCTFTMTADGGTTFTSSSPPGPTLPPGVYQIQVLMENPTSGYSCGAPDFKLTGPGVSSETRFPFESILDSHVLPALQPSSTYSADDENAPGATRVYFTTSATGSAELARRRRARARAPGAGREARRRTTSGRGSSRTAASSTRR